MHMRIPHEMNIAQVDPYHAYTMMVAEARATMAVAIRNGWAKFTRTKTPTGHVDKHTRTAEQRKHHSLAQRRWRRKVAITTSEGKL
jgi:hypothetical protein